MDVMTGKPHPLLETFRPGRFQKKHESGQAEKGILLLSPQQVAEPGSEGPTPSPPLFSSATGAVSAPLSKAAKITQSEEEQITCSATAAIRRYINDMTNKCHS
jgi:hypothetical protein